MSKSNDELAGILDDLGLSNFAGGGMPAPNNMDNGGVPEMDAMMLNLNVNNATVFDGQQAQAQSMPGLGSVMNSM